MIHLGVHEMYPTKHFTILEPRFLRYIKSYWRTDFEIPKFEMFGQFVLLIQRAKLGMSNLDFLPGGRSLRNVVNSVKIYSLLWNELNLDSRIDYTFRLFVPPSTALFVTTADENEKLPKLKYLNWNSRWFLDQAKIKVGYQWFNLNKAFVLLNHS